MKLIFFRIFIFLKFLLAFCVFSSNIAWAQSAKPVTLNNAKTGFAPLAKRLMPVVVGINVYNDKIGGSSKRFQGQGGAISSGSGFIIDAKKHVITNNHVIEMGNKFEVSLNDGTILPAKLIGRDAETDIAILEIITKQNLPFAILSDSNSVEIGDWAIAIGRPFGLGNSFSVGVISGNNRDLHSGRYDNYLQTDAAINHGNSGGPLFNEKGEVIGVNTAIIANSQNGGSLGIGFAIPINLAKRISDDIIKYGIAIRGYVGFRARLGNPNEGGGVVISAIANSSPAQKSGLKIGDKITFANGINIYDPRQLARIIASANIGTKIRIDGFRGNKKIYTIIEISRPPSLNEAVPTGEIGQVKVQGLNIRILNNNEKNKYNQIDALIINSVDEYSQAFGVFKAGDLILEIAGQKVETPQNAKFLIDKLKKSKSMIMIKIKRGEYVQYKLLH